MDPMSVVPLVSATASATASLVTNIEKWVKGNLHRMTSYEQLLKRLQRSIYSGQLIMLVMEDDLVQSCSQARQLQETIILVWDENLFKEHESRIRGQVAALHLLLQVVSTRHNDDRLEMLSVKEHISREVDDNVLNIILSRLSSQLSVTDK
ncbi:hypothetical protein K469DRAFT_686862 [Zopfia rhizophila CBS 207.26]|uniref:Uncharacterized protein n=1 Tax=Zopfia rhizophila CBS 207.26 TaxID=1314779 RepID=A0A6A6E626_9PEZI|nr:hypothetical protein K469DRAFT_686862 [Zopfia rhizophila CBS 207.26]